MRLSKRLSSHDHILELPGILPVDVLGKQDRAALKRSPIRIVPRHRAEIRQLHVKAPAKVEIVGLDNASLWIFQGPNHSGENRRGPLKPGGVLIGREPPRLLDRKLRAV